MKHRRHLAVTCVGALLGCLTGLTACGGGDRTSGAPPDTGSPTTASASATTSVSDTEATTETPTAEQTTAEKTTAPEPTVTRDDTDTGTTDADASSSDVPNGQWTGTAHVSVDFADPGCAADERSYDLPATLIIDGPVGTESNAFHLSWASDSQTAEGAFGVTSALSGTDTTDARKVEIEYWSLSDDGDGSLSGRLTDSAAAQGASLNLLFVPKPLFQCSGYTNYPYGMAVGTTLKGTVTGNSASLVLSGTSLDGTRSFRVEWS
ncbi:hypothetical protein ACIRU3_40200 [Streptomyces sp. NPDC101151]|uniref:hypothetical protein n=1 Tax=Streptomyces sp. NPDC101151 TaxID=3366115 RepID=UPI00382F8EB6